MYFLRWMLVSLAVVALAGCGGGGGGGGTPASGGSAATSPSPVTPVTQQTLTLHLLDGEGTAGRTGAEASACSLDAQTTHFYVSVQTLAGADLVAPFRVERPPSGVPLVVQVDSIPEGVHIIQIEARGDDGLSRGTTRTELPITQVQTSFGIDLCSGNPTFLTGPNPPGLPSTGQQVYVACFGGDTVAQFRASQASVETEIRNPGLQNPKEVCFNRSGDVLFVIHDASNEEEGGRSLARISPSSKQFLGSQEGLLGTFTRMQELKAHPQGSFLYVTAHLSGNDPSNAPSAVARLDGSTGAVLASVTLQRETIHSVRALAVAPAGDSIFVAGTHDPVSTTRGYRIERRKADDLSLQDHSFEESFVSGLWSFLDLSPTGQRALYSFVDGTNTRWLSLLDVPTGGAPLTRGRFAVPVAREMRWLDESRAVVANYQGTLDFLQTSGNDVTVTHSLSIGKGPVGLELTRDRKFAYVTNSLSDTVAVVNLEQEKVVALIQVPDTPLSVALTP